MNNQTSLELQQTYFKLPSILYSLIEPKSYKNTEIVLYNDSLSKELNIDANLIKSKEGVLFLSGSTNQYGPLYSQAYAGHQYGYYTTLGDGRAVIIGEKKAKDGNLYDLQLKGVGRTPYSRSGDGKATLYSMLREYLISEAMHGLLIPSTRSLSVLKTNENIRRKTIEQGGILCRVASSHIRVGTFQFAYSTGGTKNVKELADYAIERHYPDLLVVEDKYQRFLAEVIKKQAILIAKWQSVGFVHGVMNTDNMTISGETIDYGPCAFLDEFTPTKSFSSIDSNGRYAYNQQPTIGSWNLARFAETLLGLLSVDKKEAVEIANQELKRYQQIFEDEYYKIMANKIGIIDPITEEKELIDELLKMMEIYQADYTNTFRSLTLDRYEDLPFYSSEQWKKWFQKWTRQLGTRQMNIAKRIALMEDSNPAIIPRNLLVEEALHNAADNDDYQLFNTLLQKLKTPYNYKVVHGSKYIIPTKSNEEYITYCGT